MNKVEIHGGQLETRIQNSRENSGLESVIFGNVKIEKSFRHGHLGQEKRIQGKSLADS